MKLSGYMNNLADIMKMEKKMKVNIEKLLIKMIDLCKGCSKKDLFYVTTLAVLSHFVILESNLPNFENANVAIPPATQQILEDDLLPIIKQNAEFMYAVMIPNIEELIYVTADEIAVAEQNNIPLLPNFAMVSYVNCNLLHEYEMLPTLPLTVASDCKYIVDWTDNQQGNRISDVERNF